MKISCSHCELAKASENIRDSMCDHTICADCRSHGHNNAMTCPKCGLAQAKPCLHQFGPVPGSSRFSHCGLCGQLRVDEVTNKQVSSTTPKLEAIVSQFSEKVVSKNMDIPDVADAQWEQVVQKAVNKCAKVETVFCVHCQKGFEVQGDIKTWDVVYMTCIDCYRNGHRSLPRPLGTCEQCWIRPNGEMAEEPKKKPGRNLMI